MPIVVIWAVWCRCFFFSSRRRHTRFDCDWSSDVCSSDLALIVVTVDEGDSFRGGDSRRDASKTNLGDIAFIPLFVKLPGQAGGRVVEKHVTSVDVLPTIASVLGVKVHWRMDGHSTILGGPGPSTVRVSGFSMPYDAAQKLRVRARERKLRLFGSDTWGPHMAATGPYWRLVGQTPRVSGSVDGKATIDGVGSKLLRRFPRNSLLVPSPLAGSISGLARGTALAFALNGRIAAVARVYREPAGGALRFSALVGESGFRTGRNGVSAVVGTRPAAPPPLRQGRVAFS